MDHIAALWIVAEDSWKPQDVAGLAWAFARTVYCHEALMEGLAKSVAAHASSFRPRELTGSLWSFASLSNLNPEQLQQSRSLKQPQLIETTLRCVH